MSGIYPASRITQSYLTTLLTSPFSQTLTPPHARVCGLSIIGAQETAAGTDVHPELILKWHATFSPKVSHAGSYAPIIAKCRFPLTKIPEVQISSATPHIYSRSTPHEGRHRLVFWTGLHEDINFSSSKVGFINCLYITLQLMPAKQCC